MKKNVFLRSVLDGSDLLGSCSGWFTPGTNDSTLLRKLLVLVRYGGTLKCQSTAQFSQHSLCPTCRIRNTGSTACNNGSMTAAELHRNWPDPLGHRTSQLITTHPLGPVHETVGSECLRTAQSLAKPSLRRNSQLNGAEFLVPQLVKTYFAVYRTLRWISTFTGPRLRTVSWPKWILYSHNVCLRSILILSSRLRLGFQGISSLHILTKILYEFFVLTVLHAPRVQPVSRSMIWHRKRIWRWAFKMKKGL